MAKLRVLVADDSLTVRKRLVEILSNDPGLDVVGEAENGKAAIELCLRLRPDVITMDMMMPVMTGLAATEYIMAHAPTPILVVSSSTNRGELFKTYDALAAGAVDVLDKDLDHGAGGSWEARLVATVKLIARIRVITHPRLRLGAFGLAPARADASVARSSVKPRDGDFAVVALGASTGGPGALVDLIRALPERFVLPVLVVLHLNEPFAASFAEWLELQTGRTVAYARSGMAVAEAAGRVVMAPPDRHLAVRDARLVLDDSPERHSCRPSVDVLFESLAREYGGRCAAALLTGMGRDGAAGLLEIRRAGGLTIAQDEATSVVYGMPREAALLGAAEHVLPLQEIGPALGALRGIPRGERRR